MAQDEHPADGMFEPIRDAIMGMFTGGNVKQAVRDAWDRMHGASEPQSAHDQQIQQMNKQAADADAQKVAQAYLTAQQADKIRAAAKSRMGK